jgi:hypothetical protein
VVTVDREGFAGWLRAQGTPEPNVEVYLRGADVLGSFADLDAALRAEEAAGASPRRIANQREVGEQLRRFAETQRPAPALDLAEPDRRTRPASPTRRNEVSVPRPGCDCRERHDVYLDTDLGIWGKAAGGLGGVFGLVIARLAGVLGALTVGLGFLSLGGAATTLSLCWRCESCRRPIHGSALTDDERRDLRAARARFLLITIGLSAAALLCAYLWLLAIKHRDE